MLYFISCSAPAVCRWIQFCALLSLVLCGSYLPMDAASCSTPAAMLMDTQPVRLACSYRCWFVKKCCWLVYVRENTVLAGNLRSFTTSYSQTNRPTTLCSVLNSLPVRTRGALCPRGPLCTPLPCMLMKHLQHKTFAATYVQNR